LKGTIYPCRGSRINSGALAPEDVFHCSDAPQFISSSLPFSLPASAGPRAILRQYSLAAAQRQRILQRALANERKLASERERYECRVTTTAIETDSHGNTKKTTPK